MLPLLTRINGRCIGNLRNRSLVRESAFVLGKNRCTKREENYDIYSITDGDGAIYSG